MSTYYEYWSSSLARWRKGRRVSELYFSASSSVSATYAEVLIDGSTATGRIRSPRTISDATTIGAAVGFLALRQRRCSRAALSNTPRDWSKLSRLIFPRTLDAVYRPATISRNYYAAHALAAASADTSRIVREMSIQSDNTVTCTFR